MLDHFCNSFFKNLQGEQKERAKYFLLDYININFSDSNKMNVVVDVVRHSLRDMFEDILLLFLSLSQDIDIFSKIWWRGNGTSGSGNVILAGCVYTHATVRVVYGNGTAWQAYGVVGSAAIGKYQTSAAGA